MTAIIVTLGSSFGFEFERAPQMASIEYRPRATRVFAYVGKRRRIFPLGKVTKKTAERFANNIDDLIHSARCNVTPSRETSAWLSGLDDSLYETLAQAGVVPSRERAGTLSEFIEEYIAKRTDVTARRRGKLSVAKKRLVEYFGDVALEEITPGRADEYARWLLEELSPATAQKECQIAAQFFRHALRRELIRRNPFDGVAVGHATNEDRQEFIARDRVQQVVDACPDWQWRTVVALARYGGLRCPSEIAPLTWDDILWDQNRIVITSPKTARYGKANRVIPLFHELRLCLRESLEMARDGSIYVVPMLAGDGSKNIGTRFRKIIRRSGAEPWPKPFQNLRLSRQTELEQQFPSYVVCKWMGNTEAIASKHYLKVTEDHFAQAVESQTGNVLGITGNKLGTKPPAATSNEKKRITLKPEKNASFAEIVAHLEVSGIAEEGLEPPTRGL